ncbi:dTDP-4-dehydrorhamnose reductase [Rhizobium grahamii]|uniref:dTDP-4-dehydrorhamnose reductase n=1 Tax=Rhizobium grahamii TaxID=1120045 RepID=A0A370KJX1_9HYPH|nr:dTDP-4-dehydrorhamnose reductase [Rhizobium grahamii]RDJ06755.1 dTDP-4-dehydrorhamnose reductase [Rhizobium grahamii]
MNILLLGKNGQVGQELQRTLLPFGTVTALGRDGLDMEATDRLAETVRAHAPDIIVNASAWTKVDLAETETERAFRVNAEAVAVLAGIAQERKATLVHYSTDYVFDGSKPSAYREDDGTNPLSAYGRSKLAGEEAVRSSGCDAIVLRTSWVFSQEGTNFIKTILRLARERKSLRVVADQFGAPTSAELIADVTALAIAAHRRGELPGGIYHLTARGRTSWHELACYVVGRASALGFELQAGANDIQPIATEEYPLPATRPSNSLLDSGALASRLRLDLPDWTVHVERMLHQLRRRELQS